MIDLQNNEESHKQGFRQLYTSQIQQMPGQLSYQNIKLANFLELELADLWDSLQQINFDNFKNQLKESLSRSYNVFHEMKKLYNDLGMNFLYMQSKKLISSYGVIFVYLIDRLQQYEKEQQSKMRQQTLAKQNKNSFEEEVKKNIETIKLNKSGKENKKNKRNRGVHLFNQSYARCIDYDLESFRQIRQKMKQNQKSEEEKRLLKIEQERKFKKEVADQLNDFSYLKVDGEELYLFLNRHRRMDEMASKISLEDELQKIAVFFKESQHQALQFLRKQKNLESFHELTQGFNLIVTDYQNSKTNQIFFVKDKIKQIFEFLSRKLNSFEQAIKQKEKRILQLQHLLANKKILTVEQSTQTIFSYDEENKQLQRRIITSQLINEELRMYITKINEQERKEKSGLMQQITVKDSNYKQIKETLEERVNYITKIQKKYRLLVENSRLKNVQDPFQFFNNMSEEMKRFFCQQLQQQGYLKPTGKHEIKHSSFRRNTRHNQKKDSNGTPTNLEKMDKVINHESTPDSSNNDRRKRQSSFRKKAGSNFYKQNQNKNNQYQPKSGHLQFLIPDQDQKYQNGQPMNQGSRKTSFNDKQAVFKSKKIIMIRPLQTENQERVRVFDLHDRNGNSQKFVDFQSDKRLEQLKNQGGLKQKQKTFNHKARSKKDVHKKNYKAKQNDHQQSQDQDKSYDQSNMRSEKSLKNGLKKSRLKNFHASQVSENSHQESMDQYQNSNLKNQQKSGIRKKMSKPTEMKKKSTHISKQCSEEQYQQQSQNKSGNRNMRPSCELSLNQNQQSSNYVPATTEGWIPQLSETRILQKYQYHIKKCSIVNSFSLTIQNSPVLSPQVMNGETYKKIEIDQVINNKILTDKLKEIKQAKLVCTEQAEVVHEQNYESAKKINQSMKTTVRRVKKQQTQQKDENHHRNSEAPLQQRTSEAKNKKDYKNREIIGFAQSASNTFHKQLDKKKLKSQDKMASTVTTFKNWEKNRQTKQKTGRSLDKTKSLIRVSQHNSNMMVKLIEDEFGQNAIAEASRNCNTVQQFKNQVMNLHKSQCGQNCKHLQRYINIFQKLKKQNYRTKRQFIKLHVENMNEKLALTNEDGTSLNLPMIGKK